MSFITLKEELHQLVEELPEEKISQARVYLESLKSSEPQRERVERIQSIRGKYAHVPFTSEEHYRQKLEEKRREEEQSSRRLSGEG